MFPIHDLLFVSWEENTRISRKSHRCKVPSSVPASTRNVCTPEKHTEVGWPVEASTWRGIEGVDTSHTQ